MLKKNEGNSVPFNDLRPGLAAGDKAKGAANRTLRSGKYINSDSVSMFESSFGHYLEGSHCLGVANGLDALYLALRASGIGHGDEVIVPAYTFVATWLSVSRTGATPVPVDVELETANIDPQLVPLAINSKTRAIVAVHLYGGPAKVRELLEICQLHDLMLFEDAAQAHGAESEGKKVGTFGVASAFSFYPTKNLGCLGDGGAIVSPEQGLIEAARLIANYGSQDKHEHKQLGLNSRLDEIQASILCSRLPQLDSWNQSRQEIANHYLQKLKEADVKVINSDRVNQSVWHHFPILTAKRDEKMQQLLAIGIATDQHYPYTFESTKLFPNHQLEVKKSQSIAISSSVVTLPIGPWMSNKQIDKVSRALEMIF